MGLENRAGHSRRQGRGCLNFQSWRDLKVTCPCRGKRLRPRHIQASPTDMAQARRQASRPTEPHKEPDELELTRVCGLSAWEGRRRWPRLPKQVREPSPRETPPGKAAWPLFGLHSAGKLRPVRGGCETVTVNDSSA